MHRAARFAPTRTNGIARSVQTSAFGHVTGWPKVPYVGVGCLLLHEDRLLLIRRNGPHGGGTWSTPGGHLDFGEDPAECAAREALEETCITASEMNFVGITNDIFEETEKHYVTIWMMGTPDGTEAAVGDPDEVADVGWFALDDLPQPLFLSLANLLAGRSLSGENNPPPWRQ